MMFRILHMPHTRKDKKMLYLRENLTCSTIEKSPFKNVNVKINYELNIPNSNSNEFKLSYYNRAS